MKTDKNKKDKKKNKEILSTYNENTYIKNKQLKDDLGVTKKAKILMES